jgi:hypothetical protein
MSEDSGPRPDRRRGSVPVTQDISEQLAAAERELAATADAHRIALSANDPGAWRQTWPPYCGAVIEVTRLRQLAAAAPPGPGHR